MLFLNFLLFYVVFSGDYEMRFDCGGGLLVAGFWLDVYFGVSCVWGVV